jgi:hypothetical protein
VTFKGAAAGSTVNNVLGLPESDWTLGANTTGMLPGQVYRGGARLIIVAVEDFELDTNDSITSSSTASSTNLLANIPSSVPVGTTVIDGH